VGCGATSKAHKLQIVCFTGRNLTNFNSTIFIFIRGDLVKDNKDVKRILIFNIISIILCFIMLMGTTLAWFHVKVESDYSEIKASSIVIDISNSDTKAKAKKSAAIKLKDASWKPGESYTLSEVCIENKGDIDVQYKVYINSSSENAELLNYIDFTVNDVAVDKLTPQKLAVDASDKLVIAGSVKADASIENCNGKKIDEIELMVVATQDNEDATTSLDVKEWKNRLAAGGSLVLTRDISGKDYSETANITKDTVLTLAGHKITSPIEVKYGKKLTITNGITSSDVGKVKGDIYVSKGTLTIDSGKYYGTISKSEGEDSTITITGGTFIDFDPSEYVPEEGYEVQTKVSKDKKKTYYKVVAVEEGVE
jgi:hypothetical protein